MGPHALHLDPVAKIHEFSITDTGAAAYMPVCGKALLEVGQRQAMQACHL